MHLLVLSAFRPRTSTGIRIFSTCLNAPSGAQCFPTESSESLWAEGYEFVSMHLLVLSAFRPPDVRREVRVDGLNAPSGAQCFPTE